MNVVSAIVGSVSLVALIYMLTVLARFGEKLGAVTKMRPYYYGYYVAIGCLVIVALARLLRASVFWAPPSSVPVLLNDARLYLFLHHLPLAIAMTLSLAITWHYWSWLLKER